MNKTKIEWCDSTWNPVTGCYHDCEYCYARRISTRFGGNDSLSTYGHGQKNWHRADDNHIKDGQATSDKPMLFVVDKPLLLPKSLDKRKTEKYGKQIFESKQAPYPFYFNPTFHRHRLKQLKNQKIPRTIFVCSMADLFGKWVLDEWIEEVFKACEASPQHRYLFLTKNPKRYTDLAYKEKLPKKKNMWYGTSVTGPNMYYFRSFNTYNTFLSIEPLLEPLNAGIGSFGDTEWIIIGAETGKRKDKIIPQKEWVDNICEAAALTRASVFMKDSLIPIVGKENMRREFPWK